MKGATLQVLQVQWERAWMAEDFNAVTKIDNARRVIEGLAEQVAPTSDSVFFIKVTTPLPETAPRTQSQKPCRMFLRLEQFRQ